MIGVRLLLGYEHKEYMKDILINLGKKYWDQCYLRYTNKPEISCYEIELIIVPFEVSVVMP